MLHWMVVSTQLKKNRPSKLSSQVWMETRKIWGAPKKLGVGDTYNKPLRDKYAA